MIEGDMNILELVGFVVLILIGYCSILAAIGALKIDATLTRTDKAEPK